MSSYTRGAVLWTLHVLAWLAVGFSLGWYYTFTYYGRSGWPMPLVETCGALIAYYFSVLNIATPGQAVHWMLVFPLTATLWLGVLRGTAGILRAPRPGWDNLLLMGIAAALPLALPGPWFAWLAATKHGSFDLDTAINIALRRGAYPPWDWLSPACFALGAAGLALQLFIFTRDAGASRGKRIVHYLVSAIVFIAACSTFAAVASIPLRHWLE